jgi:hypothetical protein
MSWVIAVSNRARKNLKRVPVADRQRIMTELDAMHVNPLSGDVVKLAGRDAFRRRVGRATGSFFASISSRLRLQS